MIGPCWKIVASEMDQYIPEREQWRYSGIFDPYCGCTHCRQRESVYERDDDDIIEEVNKQGKRRDREEMEEDDGEEEGMMLKRGISVVTAAEGDAQSAQKTRWATQRYAVRKGVLNDILSKLRLPTPDIDAFADAKNHRFQKWWGPGGVRPSAWDEDWHPKKVGLIWANPPFSDLDRVVAKVRADQARVLLVAPDWDNWKFYKEMWAMCEDYCCYPEGSKVFEIDGREMPGVRWTVWAVLLDGTRDNRKFGTPLEVRKTDSSRRRRRRKVLRDAMREPEGDVE
jgi:hypothetical protein